MYLSQGTLFSKGLRATADAQIIPLVCSRYMFATKQGFFIKVRNTFIERETFRKMALKQTLKQFKDFRFH